MQKQWNASTVSYCYVYKLTMGVKMKAKILLAVILAFAKANAFSGTFESTINSVYPLASGDFILTFKTNNPGCTNAGNPKYHYVELNKNSVTESGLNKLMSASLTAAAAGKTVIITYDENSEYCYINRIWVQF